MDVLIFALQLIAGLVILTGIALIEDAGVQLASLGVLALGILILIEARRSSK